MLTFDNSAGSETPVWKEKYLQRIMDKGKVGREAAEQMYAEMEGDLDFTASPEASADDTLITYMVA